MSAESDVRQLPMVAHHRRLGCNEWVEEGGYRVPEHYGDAAAELEALTEQAVLYDASAWGRVEVLGPDGSRLLNGFCTLDVPALSPGTIGWGLLTEAKGHVLSDVVVLRRDDRLWLRLPPGQGKPIREHLGKYVVAEQVELLPMGDLIPIWLLGPGAARALQEVGIELPTEHRHQRLELWGTEVQIENSVLLGLRGVCLSVSASIAASFAEELTRRLDLPWSGRAALDSVRIRAGAPRWGADFGLETLPQEAGLDAAVNYEKGCYLGQEVIARLHYRGQERRRLGSLEFAGPVDVGDSLVSGDDFVGTVTSVDRVRTGPTHGVGMLKRGATEPEATLATKGGTNVTVIRYLSVDRFGIPQPDDARD